MKDHSPMKTRYKYIHFEKTEEIVHSERVWNCCNNRSGKILAKVFYYKPWKEYCFTQAEQDVVFNDGCLLDMVDFIRQLNENGRSIT
jgi:hypothetical protein